MTPLASLAARQAGRVSLAQLLDAGLTRDQVDARVETGWLHRLAQGVYAVGYVDDSPAGRWWTALLAVGPGAVLSHGSAAALWGIADEDRGPEVSLPRGTGRARRDGTAAHRTRLTTAEVVTRRGIPVTTLERTLLDLAATRGEFAARRAFEQAQVRHDLTPGSVLAFLAAHHGDRGVARLRGVVEGLDTPGIVRSVNEALVFTLLRRARPHWEAPQTNVRLPGTIWTVDFFWPERRLALEVQSRRYHGTVAAQRRDPAKAAWLESRGISLETTWPTEIHRRPGLLLERLDAHFER